MKKLKKTLSFLVSLILVLSLFSCYVQRSSPERTLAAFETAINRNDLEDMLDCLDPKIAKAMKGAAKLLGGLFDMDGDALWDMMPFLMELSGAQTQNAKVNFEVLSVDIYEDQATAEVYVSFIGNDADATIETIDFIKVERRWYISFDYSGLF